MLSDIFAQNYFIILLSVLASLSVTFFSFKPSSGKKVSHAKIALDSWSRFGDADMTLSSRYTSGRTVNLTVVSEFIDILTTNFGRLLRVFVYGAGAKLESKTTLCCQMGRFQQEGTKLGRSQNRGEPICLGIKECVCCRISPSFLMNTNFRDETIIICRGFVLLNFDQKLMVGTKSSWFSGISVRWEVFNMDLKCPRRKQLLSSST